MIKTHDLRIIIFFLMKIGFSALFFFVCLVGHSQNDSVNNFFLPASVKKILFLGNSITYAGSYVTYFESYYKLRYPKRKIEIINMGLPSETVSGLSEAGHAGNRFPRPDLHERLKRVLSLTKPDLVFACYGINDGIYMPFDQHPFEKYINGIHWLHDEVKASGADIIHITPALYDELRGKKKGYENVMNRYSVWILNMKDSAKWNVADIYHPMKKYLEAHRKIDETFNLDGFELASDGIHPNDNAHWLIARELLLYLGEKEVNHVTSIHALADRFNNGPEVVKLVNEKQMFMKDAWLSAAGHKRPEMKAGMPLKEAMANSKQIEEKITELLK